MTRLRVLVVALAAMLSMIGFTGTADAQTVDECVAKIAALRAETEAVTFLGQNADQTEAGLLSKLDAASAKLADGKLTDAAQKLSDFRTTVEALAAGTKPKISAEDAAALIAGADEAIACIEGMETTTTG